MRSSTSTNFPDQILCVRMDASATYGSTPPSVASSVITLLLNCAESRPEYYYKMSFFLTLRKCILALLFLSVTLFFNIGSADGISKRLLKR